MLRHVLVCLDPSPGNQDCQAAAVDLGAHAGAVLSGVFVRSPAPVTLMPPLPTPVFAGGGSESGDAFDGRLLAHHAEQDHMQHDAFEAFLRRAREADVRAATLVRAGALHTELVAAAQATDLVVIGRGHASEESLLSSVTGAVVRAAGRPVLVVGAWRTPLAVLAVAYDGSPGADRALSVAAELVMRWNAPKPEIVLLGVTAEDGDTELLEPARHYLRACDLPFRTAVEAGEPEQEIPQLARSVDADVLCMGAFGHSLIREALLGSTTQQVLAAWPRALLLAHE